VLPQATPITRDTFNYAGVVMFGTIFLLTIWWLVSVRKWFKGPVSQGDEATLEKIEAEINEESIYKEPSVAGQ
jgi:hypothetical protein